MSHQDNVDVRTLFQLETDLSDQTVLGFVEEIRRRFGLANSVYFCPSFPGRNLADPLVVSTYSVDWTNYYIAQGYISIDPVISIGARAAHPIDWELLPREDKRVRRMFAEAEEAGVGRHGLTFPIRGPLPGVWALFIATSDDRDGDWAGRRCELMRELAVVANYAHQLAYRLHGEEPTVDLNAITTREIEALEWAADGKTVAETAVLMRIPAAVVRAHLESARHKLRALNCVHAVTKALREGLIH